MRLGIMSAILGELGFEEMIDFISSEGLTCVEVACWPSGKAERRYAGVSHIDAANLTEEKAEEINRYCKERGVEISALAYYPNMMDPDLEKRDAFISHLYKVIDASRLLGVHLVTTFIGRMPAGNLEENLKEAGKVWPPILEYAKKQGVRIAIENCPMLFTQDEWPGGQNIMTSPANWRKVFEILDSGMLGINFDPSHFVWQQMDYIKPIYEFRDKIFHIHFKDVRLLRDKLDDVGIMAPPLAYMSPKIPGLGDVDWARYVSALSDIGYDGYACIEIEDKEIEDTIEDAKNAIRISAKYLKNLEYAWENI